LPPPTAADRRTYWMPTPGSSSIIVTIGSTLRKRGRLSHGLPAPPPPSAVRPDETERCRPHALQGRSPVRGSHGKNPAPPLWNDLSARRHDIHLCRASNLGEIRATTTPLKNADTFLAPPPCKAARGEAVLAQPCRKADKGALVNGPSKGLLVGISPTLAMLNPLGACRASSATVARLHNLGVHLEPL
jgi:hypothetical protein